MKLKLNIMHYEEGCDDMYIIDSHERELWEKVKPYIEGSELKKDAPDDVVKAREELRKLAWEQEQ